MTVVAIILIGWISLNVALVVVLYRAREHDVRSRVRRFLLR
jgi:hypothetical protein